MAQSFQAQLISLVCEGVFEHFPTLKFVLIEGGFAWLSARKWRLDRSWRRLREEAPHVRVRSYDVTIEDQPPAEADRLGQLGLERGPFAAETYAVTVEHRHVVADVPM
jgi:predicted TIM-barrel fold metal-dependent hydrolase